MTIPLPCDLALSMYGGCLAEPFQDRIRGYKRRRTSKGRIAVVWVAV